MYVVRDIELESTSTPGAPTYLRNAWSKNTSVVVLKKRSSTVFHVSPRYGNTVGIAQVIFLPM